jgi:hypothetical protein
MAALHRALDFISLNASNYRYFILDEIDNLDRVFQKDLKTALNNKFGIFILTSNNISNIDNALLDRCILVEMNAAQPTQFLPIAHRVLSDINPTLEDTEIIDLVKKLNGSFRNIMWELPKHARRKSMSVEKAV